MIEDQVICGDSLEVVSSLETESIHLILSDIPYGIGADDWDVLHSNTNSALLGSSPAQDKAGAIFKRRGKPLNGWSEADRLISQQYYDWCREWSSEWLRVLKPGASAMVFAGRRMAHRCISALEDTGFTYKDMLSWVRERAPHRAQRLSVVFERRGDEFNGKRWEGWRVGNLRPSFEPILWFVKPYEIGTTITDNMLSYEVGAFNERAFLRYQGEPENILSYGFQKGEGGLHPTQKPLRLMKALVELTTGENQIVLDPFCGSGTTLLAAQLTNRRYLGVDKSEAFVEVSKRRLSKPSLFGDEHLAS